MKLYRPVGLYEMEKILNENCKEFPPRYTEQPFFYPVLNEKYANQIAEKWNQNDAKSGFVGFVTEFNINDQYIQNYEIHCVGDEFHQEFWIPAAELKEFNKNILGNIKIKEAYYGNDYKGIKPMGVSGFKVEDIYKQIDVLKCTLNYNHFDFSGTIYVEWKLINLNLLFWLYKTNEYTKTLEAIFDSLEKNSKMFISNRKIQNYFKNLG